MNKKSNLCAFILLFAFNSSFYGQITSDTISVQLSDVEIVGQRNKLYSELGRVLTVIDKEEINRMPVHSIDELFDQISGLDIRQRGTFGVQADISVHGGSFDQVLVLLNGINITDPQTGHFNLDIPLNFNEIDRIEILQGSAARLLGPNAFSGAINIITNQNKKQNQLKAELSAGSNEYSTQNISTDFNIKNVTNFISFSHKSSDGYIENTDFDITNIFLHSSLKTTTGKFDFQIAGRQKGFGANEFYSLTYLHQDKNAEQFDSKYALDYLKHKANLKLEHSFWKNLTGTWVISYFDRAGNYTDFQTQKAVNYKPYFLADFQVNWVKSQYEIYTNLNNLLNVRYENYGGIVQPGFTFNVGFRWKFI